MTAAELDDDQVVANPHAFVVGPEGEGSESRQLPDAVLAIALAVVGLTDLWVNLDNSTHYGPDLSAAVVILVVTLALTWRRRYPFQTLCVVAGMIAVPELAGTLTFTLWGHFLPLLVAAYSVARWCSHRLAWVGAAIVSGVVAVVLLRVPATGGVDNIPFAVVPIAAVMVTGRVLRRREAGTVALATRAHRLEVTRDAEVAAAVAEERNRIARELHDIVAHCVSVMIVQAGASEALLGHSPDRARIPLQEVQKTGQQAIAELTRMLGVLRGPRHDVQSLPGQLEPQPGVSEVPMLLERFASSGLDVRLSVFGDARPLPPGTDLTVYRVTQEALTNTLKHAGPAASARVELQYLPHTLEIEVTDTGGPDWTRRDTASGSTVLHGRTGHGLIGMAERVSVFGGSFEYGHQPDGGYRVHVTLPAAET